jgi:endonuclease/exonuclease/phosphatase (EEP) superfamily protein YafD
VLAGYAPPVVVLVPVFVIALAAAFARAFRLAAVGVVAFVVLAYAEGGRLSAGRPSASSAAANPGRAFRVMTYNVAQWGGGATAIARAVEWAAPDIVCLEEAGAYPWATGADQGPEALARALPGYSFVGDGEVRIASRFPLRDARAIPLPPGQPSRPLVLAVADARGGELTVAAVHLIPTLLFQPAAPGSQHAPLGEIGEGRLQQAEHILSALDDVPGPVVLCGDFNGPPTAPPLRRIAARLRDAWTARGNGFGLTDPTSFPLWRIDHVFVRDLRVDDVVVCRVCEASDHLPVVATISLAAPTDP